jgi:hypothetical protein
MFIDHDLLTEVTIETKSDFVILKKIVESVLESRSEAKRLNDGKKFDYGLYLDKACDDERFNDFLVRADYKQAAGKYFGHIRSKRNKLSDSWEVLKKDTNHVRVLVAPHTSYEFRIVISTFYRNKKKVEHISLDSQCLIHHSEGPREVFSDNMAVLKQAEKRALIWLKAEKQKPKAVR